MNEKEKLADEILTDLIDYWENDSGPYCPHCHQQKGFDHYGWCRWLEWFDMSCGVKKEEG